jgi:hypothetical protein
MNDIFKITKDERRAKALTDLARKRYLTISELKEPYRIIEEYYEIIKELITAVMYKSGFKTLSHLALIEFAKENIKVLTSAEISLIDDLRIKRNNIVYYGETVTSDFLSARKSVIDWIIEKMLKTC